MMLRVLSFFYMLAAMVAAFAPVLPPSATRLAGTRSPSLTPAFMFSGDGPKGLEEVEDTKQSAMESSTTVVVVEEEEIVKADAPKAVYRNLARGGEVTEVPWVDDAMRANTKPWEMSWWAYLIFGLPFTLLANDFFHFLPKDGPLSFLTTL